MVKGQSTIKTGSLNTGNVPPFRQLLFLSPTAGCANERRGTGSKEPYRETGREEEMLDIGLVDRARMFRALEKVKAWIPVDG